VYIGSQSHVGPDGGCLFRSRDNGATWAESDNNLRSPSVYTFAKIGGTIFAGTYAGIYASSDSGSTWSIAGLGVENVEVHSFLVKDSMLYAGSYYANVLFSTDEGSNWDAHGGKLPNNSVFALALYGSKLVAGTVSDGAYLSLDTGRTWIRAGLADGSTNGQVYALQITGNYLLAGTDNGVWRTPLSYLDVLADVSLKSTSHSSLTSFPNPFNESTTIRFTLNEYSQTSVSIVNVLGEEVARLFSGELDAGEHSLIWNAHNITEGTYFCTVRANGNVTTLPITVMK
jgi:hypothetical protein